jgi:hypothetical protein
MPTIKNNPLVKGASGHFSRQFVYKQRGSKTYIAKMPSKNDNLEPTPEQTEIRESFAEASAYAAGAMADPVLKKEYQKKAKDGATAYNIAFRDYMKAPVVKSIDLSKYNGQPGSLIIVKAKDDFRVASVHVSIHTATGVFIESGNAVLNPINRNKWNYTAIEANSNIGGFVIKAEAFDLPGNKGSLETHV